MSDPYKVLGISSSATDDEIKKAYRELAKKFHPDNYHDNPLADLAQERMKEINEAYEQIQNERKRGSASTYGYGQQSYSQGYGQSYGQSYGTYGNAAGGRLPRVRMAIQQNDLNLAEELLNAQTDHDGEWNYLKGVICSRRGWKDEARRYFQTAVQMEPDNGEYQRALDAAEGRRTTYNPFGNGTVSTTDCGDASCLRWCTTMACCSAMSGGGCYFIPCCI